MLGPNSTVSRDEAIRAFGKLRNTYCDGQFVAASAGLLCFFDRERAKAMSPVSMKWTPARDYKVNAWTMNGPPVWMPASPDGKYHILLQDADGSAYTYLGSAHLAVSSRGKDPWTIFEFEHKLPKDEWLKAGGYDGWLLSGDYSGLLAAAELDKLDAILAGHENGPFSIQLKRYEGDDLVLSTNTRRAILRLGHRYAVGDQAKEAAPELFQQGSGAMGLYVPADKTLSMARAVAATREFFSEGRFPEWVAWEEFDSDDEWFSERVVTALRHLFGHSLHEAGEVLARYLALPARHAAAPDSDSVFNEGEHHDGPEAVAYAAQWSVVVGERPHSMEFLAWRSRDYERRKSTP
jgi:hypothetical protein